jgi:hypothetical protein
MMGTVSGTVARGRVEEGWEKVADAFCANFGGNPGEARRAVLQSACVLFDRVPTNDNVSSGSSGYPDSHRRNGFHENQ